MFNCFIVLIGGISLLKNKGLLSDIFKYYGIIILLHILGIVSLLSTAKEHPTFLGLGLLAYTFGLRHAFDADHIAAIDNSVRKLMQQQKNSNGVGFYFSLGHSSVVLLMVLGLAFSLEWLQNAMPNLEHIGGIIGTTVSGTFLLVIGFINLLLLISSYKILWKVRRNNYISEHLDKVTNSHGFITKFAKPLFKFISKSWHLYPLGFLFGLGFDTATEVGLLVISSGATQSSIPVYGILSLPVLFAAGMSFMDTTDGMFMSKAYQWAFKTPIHKLFYNITITLVSVVTALLIGLVEVTQVIVKQAKVESSFGLWIKDLEFGNLGIYISIVFLILWGSSYLAWRHYKPIQ